jgi:hypothetical protein
MCWSTEVLLAFSPSRYISGGWARRLRAAPPVPLSRPTRTLATTPNGGDDWSLYS